MNSAYAPTVTTTTIQDLMERVQYLVVVPEGTTSTFVHAYLDGNFFLGTGFSACVVKENFNAEKGFSIAQPKAEAAAREKLWELEGYQLYQSLQDKTVIPEVAEAAIAEIGDLVLYYEQGKDVITEPLIGMISAITGPNQVSLSVLDQNGKAHPRVQVPLLRPNDEPNLTMTYFAKLK